MIRGQFAPSEALQLALGTSTKSEVGSAENDAGTDT